MITFDQAITNCQDTAIDYSASSLTFFKRKLNEGYKQVLANLSRQKTERTQTGLTVANQQYYQLPRDYLFLKSVTVTSGTTVYPITEVESQEQWNYLNVTSTITNNVPQFYFIRQRTGIGMAEVGLWPTPSSSGNTISIVYEAVNKDLSQTAYTTGTATVTLNSTAVTGSGTTWTPSMVGRYFQITDSTGLGDGYFYRIASVLSTTSITLEQTYEGSTDTATYQICEIFEVPEDLQILPVYYALYHYYLTKQRDDLSKDYNAYFVNGIAQAKQNYNTKNRSSVIRQQPTRRFFGKMYPPWFPSSGISS